MPGFFSKAVEPINLNCRLRGIADLKVSSLKLNEEIVWWAAAPAV
jgi:hypothetical protein